MTRRLNVLMPPILLAAGIAASRAGEPAGRETTFESLAQRIPHFREKLESPDEQVRFRLLQELTYFHARDSRTYPAYFRYLLNDPSPRVRWEGMHRLWEHGQLPPAEQLPRSFSVPLLGAVDRRDSRDMARLRKTASSGSDAGAGWAIHALGFVRDPETAGLAVPLVASSNVFTRFSAACALINVGGAEAGTAELVRIVDASDDASVFYRYRAAETLARLGNPDYIDELISLIDSRSGYADGPINVLADLTGQYFTTTVEWRRWWDRNREGWAAPAGPGPDAAAETKQEPTADASVASHGKVIHVRGNIASPGSYDLTEDMTLLKALATAGGYADGPKAVNVIRERGGGRVTLRFDTGKIERGEAEDPRLLPGDVVVVPRTDGK